MHEKRARIAAPGAKTDPKMDPDGVLLASLSNETLDFEKHHRKTHDFGEKKRARSEKRRPWKEKASPN